MKFCTKMGLRDTKVRSHSTIGGVLSELREARRHAKRTLEWRIITAQHSRSRELIEMCAWRGRGWTTYKVGPIRSGL